MPIFSSDSTLPRTPIKERDNLILVDLDMEDYVSLLPETEIFQRYV